MARYLPKYLVQAVMGAAGSGSLTAAILWLFVHLAFWPTFGVVFALYLIPGLVRAVRAAGRERGFNRAMQDRNRQEAEEAQWPRRQLTLPDGYEVEFRRKPDGEVVFSFLSRVDNLIAIGVSSRAELELTKAQLRESESDFWCPGEVEAARREVEFEDMRIDEQGHEIRTVMHKGTPVTFIRESDGEINMTHPRRGQDGVQRRTMDALQDGLTDELAPLDLTKAQLRRGEEPWYPELAHEAHEALNRRR